MLENQPHAFHVVPGVAPVAQGVQVAQVELVLHPLGNAGGRQSDFPRDEVFPAAFAFMVEQDAVDGEHAVGFPVVFRDPEAVLLGDAIRGARIERGGFLLRDFLHQPEEFGRGRLVDPAFLFHAQDAHRFQHPQGAYGVRFRRVFRHVKADFHVALRGQVVDFVRLDGLDDADQGA